MGYIALSVVSATVAFFIHRLILSCYSSKTLLGKNQKSIKQQPQHASVTAPNSPPDDELPLSNSKDSASTPSLTVSAPTTTAPPCLSPSPPTIPTPRLKDHDLMPPPPRPATLKPAQPRPLPQATLRVPTTAPLPNRTPSSNRPFALQPPTSSLSPSTLPQPRRTLGATASHTRSRKVVLAPGHSPLDWAVLTKDPRARLSGLPLEPGGPLFLRVTPGMLAGMNGRGGRPMWTSFKGRVYNVGPYLPFHPGGAGELKRCAGKGAEVLFDDVHPWVNFEGLLGACEVGVLVEESSVKDEGLEGLD